MKILECEQGSEAWLQARCGVATASNFDQIICIDGKPSKQRTKYLYRLAGERISGKSEEVYQNGAMARGKELEAEARKFYELMHGEAVQQVGLCLSDEPFVYGASPDALIGDDGGMEIKCPMVTNHVAYLLGGKLPSDYFQQVQGSLFVTGRKWWDFVSYYPSMKPLVVRVLPDLEFHAKLKTELELFCVELEQLVKKIK